MPPFVEVPCKTLKELPRNVGENVLALAAVNKKWSSFRTDVRNHIVAPYMSRSTPSAMAFKRAFGKIINAIKPEEHWIEAEAIKSRKKQNSDSEWKVRYVWNINCETGHVYQHWVARWVSSVKKRSCDFCHARDHPVADCPFNKKRRYL